MKIFYMSEKNPWTVHLDDALNYFHFLNKAFRINFQYRFMSCFFSNLSYTFKYIVLHKWTYYMHSAKVDVRLLDTIKLLVPQKAGKLCMYHT